MVSGHQVSKGKGKLKSPKVTHRTEHSYSRDAARWSLTPSEITGHALS